VHLPVQASTLQKYSVATLERMIRKQAQTVLPESVSLLDIQKIQPVMLESSVDEINLKPLSKRLYGQVPMLVSFIKNGQVIQEMQIVCVLEAYEQQWFFKRRLEQGRIIQDEDVIEKQVQVKYQPDVKNEVSVHDILGKKLKKSVQANERVTPFLLDKVPVVMPQDLVKIILIKNQVVASVPGQISQAGAVGDKVYVLNTLSKKTMLAKVINSSTVEVIQ